MTMGSYEIIRVMKQNFILASYHHFGKAEALFYNPFRELRETRLMPSSISRSFAAITK